MVENQIGKTIKILCSDQGGEYRLGEFMNFLQAEMSYFMNRLNKERMTLTVIGTFDC